MVLGLDSIGSLQITIQDLERLLELKCDLSYAVLGLSRNVFLCILVVTVSNFRLRQPRYRIRWIRGNGGFRFLVRVTYGSGREDVNEMVSILKEEFKAIGIDLKPNVVDYRFKTFFSLR